MKSMHGLLAAVSTLALSVVSSDCASGQDVKGFPGWSQSSLDLAWNKAKARHSLPDSHPLPSLIRGPAPGHGATECEAGKNGDPGVFDIALFPDQIAATFKLDSYADLNSPDMIEEVSATLTHELFHQCQRAAGVPCVNVLCEELAVENATLTDYCEEAGLVCLAICAKIAAGAPQSEIDQLVQQFDSLCKAIASRRGKYTGGRVSEKWSEQLCLCHQGGWTGSSSCPDVIMPPVPDNPTPGADIGGGPCDFPDGGDQEPFPACDVCETGCICPVEPEEDDE